MSFEEMVAATVARVVREEVPAAVRRAMAETQPVSVGDYLTPAEAAKVASVHVDTVRLWLKSGRLPKHYANSRMRVRRAELDRFLAAGPPDDGEGPSAQDIATAALTKRRAP